MFQVIETTLLLGLKYTMYIVHVIQRNWKAQYTHADFLRTEIISRKFGTVLRGKTGCNWCKQV